MADMISFARGAPSLDIVDVDGLSDAADARVPSDPAGTTAYGTSIGYVPLRELDRRAARRRARAGDRHERLDAGRRVPVRGARRARATPSSSRRRPTTARCCRCASAAPTLHMVELRARRHRRRRRSRRCSRAARGRSSRTSSPTSRTRPATRSRREKRDALLALAAEHGFTIFEDDPYVELRFERRAAADDAVARTAPSASSTRRRSRRPSARASASATWSARRTLIARDRASWPRTPTSRRTWSPSRSSTEFCALGRARRARSRPSRRALRERVERARRGAGARAARGALRAARRAATSCGSSCPRAPTSPRCSTPPRERGVSSSRAPTSCSRAARTPCASPTRASRASRSTRASRAWPRRTRLSAVGGAGRRYACHVDVSVRARSLPAGTPPRAGQRVSASTGGRRGIVRGGVRSERRSARCCSRADRSARLADVQVTSAEAYDTVCTPTACAAERVPGRRQRRPRRRQRRDSGHSRSAPGSRSQR